MDQYRTSSYLSHRRKLLRLLSAMWSDPRVQLYRNHNLPIIKELAEGSVFLAGPTSRHQILEHNWRCLAVYYLRRAGFRGYIYVPEPHGQEQSGDFTEKSFIHYWESSRLNDAKCVAFWIPRKADELLGLNTNLELGIFLGKYSNLSKEEKEKKLFIGWPRDAERMGLPHHYAHELGEHRIYQEIKQLCEAIAQQMI